MRLLGLALAPLLLGACSPDRPDDPTRGSGSAGLVRLGAAITGLNEAREAVLAAQADLVAGAEALDEVDEAASAGARTAARAARREADTAVPRTKQALAALPERLAAYRSAVAALEPAADAATELGRRQRGLLLAVGTTATAELAAAEALRTTGNGAWASYTRLDRATRTWLERATAGWYRSEREARDAYDVLVSGVRPRLEQAREALQRADVARRAAGMRVSTAVREADAALAPLRVPS